MARDRSLVRASDIAAWSYCRRAWWLANVKRVPHQNPALLEQGTLRHRQHGQAVVWAGRLRILGITLALVGATLALAAIWFWLR